MLHISDLFNADNAMALILLTKIRTYGSKTFAIIYLRGVSTKLKWYYIHHANVQRTLVRNKLVFRPVTSPAAHFRLM